MKIPLEVVIGSAGGLLFLLILAHVGLLMVNVTKLKQHKQLKAEWAQIEPQKQQADEVVKEMRLLQNKYKDIAAISGGEVILWAQKLNAISDNMPRGVWLSKIALNDEMFFIEGSAISRQQNEMISVHNFTAKLKKHPLFFVGLSELELGSIQRRSQGKIDIADFLITTKIAKANEEDEDQKAGE